MSHKETIIAWLNKAHALEHNLIQVLEHRIQDAKDHPEMQQMVQQHLAETRRHAELVSSCIERLGGHTSAIKTGMANVMGTVQGMSTEPAPDEIVKNVIADYSSEQLEIASYNSLLAAAQAIGDQEMARIFESILRDEEAMASFLSQQLPLVTQEYLSMRAREHGA